MLREQAQPMPEVRRMLLRVNKIAVEELARESGVSVSTVYMTLRGERQNGRVVEKMSELLGVSKEALFPPAA